MHQFKRHLTRVGLLLGLLALTCRAAELPLVQNGTPCAICIDASADPTVQIAAKMLADDIERISGVRPPIVHQLDGAKTVLLMAQIGQSPLLTELAKSHSLPLDEIKGSWERFLHTTLTAPRPGIEQLLVVAGSDRRGTAYGALQLSRMLGVSPWVWWADVEPAKKPEIRLDVADRVFDGPAVKYRGIFINDEDVNFRPWAVDYFNEPDVGPKAYAAVFELMMRLRANYIWPAMHNYHGRSFAWNPPPYETKPFYYVPGNKEIAGTYGIVMGTSHHEPLHRNNLFEWRPETDAPYGYVDSKEIFLDWLGKRVNEVTDEENIFTLAMRGKGDASISKMLPPGADEVEVVQNGILDQRKVLEKVFGRPASEIPQIFVAYSEGLRQMKDGLVIPDDVMLVWPDDNYGKMRGFPDEAMQKRSGGHGLYYHFEHLGARVPNRYCWLDSFPLDLVVQEHLTALEHQVDDLWIVNVGDIKPHEKEIEFYMELAWNPTPWTAENATDFYHQWAEQTFGADVAADIAAIQNGYIELVRVNRPEYTAYPNFKLSRDEQIERTAIWRDLIAQTDALSPRIPARLQDAFFQLIAYPVKAAGQYQLSHYLGERSRELAAEQKPEANILARQATDHYLDVIHLTTHYTTAIQNGKWKHMMVFNNFTPLKPPVVGWVYKKTPELPALDLADARLESPMKASNGKLVASAPTRCTPETGGSASWTFTSPLDGYVDLWMELDCPGADRDSLYITLNGKTVCTEWLMNEPVSLKKEQQRKKGPLWQRVLALDLQKGENTLTLSQCEPLEIFNLRLQPISVPAE